MKNLQEQEMYIIRDAAIDRLESMNYEIEETYFPGEWEDPEAHPDVKVKPLYFLAQALEIMSQCDAVYFLKGWETARGCKIQHEVAKSYGLTVIYEECESKESE